MNYQRIYAKFLNKQFKAREPLKVVADSSNGSTGLVLSEIEKMRSNISFALLNQKPDGNFPAHGPDPLKKGAMEELKSKVLEEKADLGMIFDADGDRVFFVDDRGREVDPDSIALLLMGQFKPPYVIEVRAGYLLVSRDIIRSKAGHYFIKKTMREHKTEFGGERTGHYFFKDFFYCDSGIFAAIHVMNAVSVLKKRNMRLSDWLFTLPRYFREPEANFEAKDSARLLKKIESAYKKQARKVSKLDGLSMEFKNFWFNIRPSNTEPLIRLNMEATGEFVLRREFAKIKSLVLGGEQRGIDQPAAPKVYLKQ